MSIMRQPLQWFYLWLAVGWLLVAWVIYLSLTSSPVQTPGILYGDKLGHLIAYFVLMTWFAQLYMRARHGFILVCFVLLGIGMEFIQGTTPHRSFEYADMVANSLGALSAWWLVGVWSGLARVLGHLEQRLGY